MTAAPRAQPGPSLVLVSDDLRLVADRKDSLVVMPEGRLVESGASSSRRAGH
ncbi:hypothetical protein [Streptomyces sp. NBC_01615]|uniref:hypothetical protein n=1 Tax=Streptomyces sp. NBC_01615 TaxID=2975898 RepID=UPI00386D6816